MNQNRRLQRQLWGLILGLWLATFGVVAWVMSRGDENGSGVQIEVASTSHLPSSEPDDRSGPASQFNIDAGHWSRQFRRPLFDPTPVVQKEPVTPTQPVAPPPPPLRVQLRATLTGGKTPSATFQSGSEVEVRAVGEESRLQPGMLVVEIRPGEVDVRYLGRVQTLEVDPPKTLSGAKQP